MSIQWWLIVFSAAGAVLCSRYRAAAPALVFGVVAMGLFVLTPAGQDVLYFIQNVMMGADAAAGGSAGGVQ